MIQTVGEPQKGQSLPVDATSLTESEVRQGVMNQGKALGSFSYFILDEINRCFADRAGVVAFLSSAGELRVYYVRPEHRTPRA